MVKGNGEYISIDYEKVINIFLKYYETVNVTRDVLRNILVDDNPDVPDSVKEDLDKATRRTTVEKLKFTMLQFPLKQFGNDSGDFDTVSGLYTAKNLADLKNKKLSDISEMERFKKSVSTSADELIGNVKADDGETIVLENGTDGTDATFKGDVTGNIKDSKETIIYKHDISGNFNTAFGDVALHKNTTGENNTAIGKSALYSNTEGSWNTAIGRRALEGNKTGIWNTAIGSKALFERDEMKRCTAIGYLANVKNDPTIVNATAIGYNAQAPASNTIKLGDEWVTDIKTNNSCRISAGVFNSASIASTLGADPKTHFNNYIAGKRGDMRLADDNSVTGHLCLMVCIKEGDEGDAVWNKITFT